MTLHRAPAEVDSVPGELYYLAPRATVLRRFAAPGASINTGVYEPHVVPVRNGRPVQDTFSVDVHGFEVVGHRSAVADFTDPAEVDEVYVPEVLDLVRARTGADEVAACGWVRRRSVASGENSSQPQAALVHVDYAPEGAGAGAAAVYAEHFPDGAGYRRAVATGTWRVFSPPPQDWPLALCDFRSVGPAEGLPNDLYLVDELPADPFGEIGPGARRVPDGSEFRFSPDHRWWYFPDMTRDEVLFFVFHDTDHGRPWRAVHSAFRDPTAAATVPRHSIEFRTFAFFR